jgi:UDP-glucose 4-epimerase
MESFKVLLIGGSGFIGSHLTDALMANGKEVVVYDLQEPKQQVSYKKISTLDKDLAEKIEGEKIDQVVNLAVFRAKNNEDIQKEIEVNVIGVSRVFEAAKKFQLPIIHFSSSAIYGEFVRTPADEGHPLNPITSYGFSKLVGEEIGKKIIGTENSLLTVFRPSIVYGYEGSDVVTTFIKNAILKKPINLIDNGKHKRDFIYVKDLAEAVLAAMNKKANGVFNIGSGKEIKISDIAGIIKKIIPDLEIIEVKSSKKEVDQGALDISKAKKEFGYEPKYSLEDGIKETIALYSSSDNTGQVHD